MEWALRLAISRCAGNADAITTTLAEIADAHGCTGCVLMRLLDVVACVVEADEIAVYKPNSLHCSTAASVTARIPGSRRAATV
jgi:hypothetical protein